MTITLYNTTSPNNKINKTLTNATVLTGDFREETGLLSPVFRVEGMQYRNYNYAYVPDFGRYYFVKPGESLGHNILELELEVDDLMSRKTKILATNAYIERASLASAVEPDIDDNTRISKSGLNDYDIPYDTSISTSPGAIILLTVGTEIQQPSNS